MNSLFIASATLRAPEALPASRTPAAKGRELPRYSRGMATVHDVRRIALSLPGTVERVSRGSLDWRVRDRGFVWERPLRQGDILALGDRAPDGPVFAARTADEGVKLALIADDPAVFFTTPHFDGYNAVLFELDRIGLAELTELITEAWLARAPRTLVRAFLDT